MNDLDTGTLFTAACLAQLGGFAVVLDGRGSAMRERSFRHASLGAVHTASNLDDHEAAIRQLAELHPIDLDRVGMTGFSGGGYATALAAFTHGDFFKVTVAGAGNYDQALFWHGWGERYHGAYDPELYAQQAAASYASGLQGRLMLIHGLLDGGCHPTGLFNVVQALNDANKDYDLVLLPQIAHGSNGYADRRRLDHFVTHLFGGEPPKGATIEGPHELLMKKMSQLQFEASRCRISEDARAARGPWCHRADDRVRLNGRRRPAVERSDCSGRRRAALLRAIPARRTHRPQGRWTSEAGTNGTAAADVAGEKPTSSAVGSDAASAAPIASSPIPAATGPVQIGFVVTKNNASAGAALGLAVDNGDERAVVQTLVDSANKAGGLAGHRIAPVYYELDPSTSKSFDTLGQEVCAAFTQDARVTAALGTTLFETANACLSSKGVPAINGSPQGSYSEAELAQMTSVVIFGSHQPARRRASWLPSTGRATSPRSREWVSSPSMPPATATRSHNLVKQLRAEGAQADEANVVYAPEVNAVSDVGSVATAMQSAVLRMRSAGVTHVVFLTNAAIYALLFMEQASQQGSTFKYALSSNDAPAVLGAQGVPEKQLTGVMAAGWDPYLDVSPGKAAGTPSGRVACDRILAKLKLQPGSNGEWVAHMHCDAFHALTEASSRTTGALDRASLLRALASIGSIDSANVWKASLTATHRWAVSGVRASHYDQACGCFVYIDKRLDAA